MTLSFASAGDSGAMFEISGTVPTNATWSEDIYFSEEGAAMDISGLDFKLTFRADADQDSADITLSTDAGTLSVVEDTDAGVDRILRILVTAGTFNSYEGDFIADLASRDTDSKVTLWAHGVVTFQKNPVAWS
jgi:hypothetical protein